MKYKNSTSNNSLVKQLISQTTHHIWRLQR